MEIVSPLFNFKMAYKCYGGSEIFEEWLNFRRGKIFIICCPASTTGKAYKLQRMSRRVGVEVENSPTGPLWPRLNKLIIEVEMKIPEKDMAISYYFCPKFTQTNFN